MPYKSRAQFIAMHINAPEVARRWDRKYGKRVRRRRKKLKK